MQRPRAAADAHLGQQHRRLISSCVSTVGQLDLACTHKSLVCFKARSDLYPDRAECSKCTEPRGRLAVAKAAVLVETLRKV
eukprot:3208621-Pleurochrysis_carterae.AAC.1